jgi:hypothetical protein
VVLIIGFIVGWPRYNVYRAQMSGRAQLAQAQQNRQIAVLEARARLDSAALVAQADVRRAEGIAAANQILANSLGGPEGYLRWKYIEMLETTGQSGRDVIYVPTEGNLPILEAGRLPRPRRQRPRRGLVAQSLEPVQRLQRLARRQRVGVDRRQRLLNGPARARAAGGCGEKGAGRPASAARVCFSSRASTALARATTGAGTPASLATATP